MQLRIIGIGRPRHDGAPDRSLGSWAGCSPASARRLALRTVPLPSFVVRGLLASHVAALRMGLQAADIAAVGVAGVTASCAAVVTASWAATEASVTGLTAA